MTIDSIFFNGNNVEFSHNNDEILVDIGTVLSLGSTFSATIYYNGNGFDNENYAGGLHHDSGSDIFNNQDLTYTFNQPFGSNVWFPCKQVLSDKIDSMDILVTTEASLKVSSNGIMVQQIDMDNGTTQYIWKTHVKHIKSHE